MDQTVDALERKLPPGELVDELWKRVKGGPGEIGSALGDTVRDHPMPLALMGMGLAWLAIERTIESRGDGLRRRYGHGGQGTSERAEGRVGPYRGDDVIDPKLRYRDDGETGAAEAGTVERISAWRPAGEGGASRRPSARCGKGAGG